jgi:hypothetical protein
MTLNLYVNNVTNASQALLDEGFQGSDDRTDGARGVPRAEGEAERT